MKQRLLLLIPTATYRAGAFVEAAQRLDIDITLASEKPNALTRARPIDLLTLDFASPAKAAAQAATFSAKHPINAVVGVDDQVSFAAAAIGRSLSVPHNPLAAVLATRNKFVMRLALSNYSVPVPNFRPIPIGNIEPAVSNGVDFPCVVKPLSMSASRGVIRVDDPALFVDTCRRVASIVHTDKTPGDDMSRTFVLAESYVPGWEVAVEGIVTKGQLHMLAIFDKPDPLEGPYFPETIYVTPSAHPTAIQNNIEQLVQNAIDALGISEGPIHAEIRGDENTMQLIEIAARSIGGYCSKVLRFDGGLSLEDVILRHALRIDSVPPAREDRAAGVMMLQAPRAGVFREVRGVDEARSVSGIEELIISANPGQKLVPLPEGFLYSGFLFARGATTGDVEAALRKAYGCLDFQIDT